MPTRGFVNHRPADSGGRLPPGQHVTEDFPVLSFGPTPRIQLDNWNFTLRLGPRPVKTWTWAEFNALPQTSVIRDIHCVTTWTKFNTKWEGVVIDDLLRDAALTDPPPFVLAHSYDGYSTNLATSDVRNGKALVALKYNDMPIPPDHGGPARLLVPHLYFWKSAKWVNAIQFIPDNTPGFWELRGYNDHGDPWKEERYQGD
ncbi:MAG: molybdopterin-dependent oxidoreductase [Candidatus Tumulicola sp.]